MGICTISSGSSGKRVMVPEPSRSIFCLMRRIALNAADLGDRHELLYRIVLKIVVDIHMEICVVYLVTFTPPKKSTVILWWGVELMAGSYVAHRTCTWKLYEGREILSQNIIREGIPRFCYISCESPTKIDNST